MRMVKLYSWDGEYKDSFDKDTLPANVSFNGAIIGLNRKGFYLRSQLQRAVQKRLSKDSREKSRTPGTK